MVWGHTPHKLLLWSPLSWLARKNHFWVSVREHLTFQVHTAKLKLKPRSNHVFWTNHTCFLISRNRESCNLSYLVSLKVLFIAAVIRTQKARHRKADGGRCKAALQDFEDVTAEGQSDKTVARMQKVCSCLAKCIRLRLMELERRAKGRRHSWYLFPTRCTVKV